ncbi:MAG TPA: hypothetical protein VI542_05480, partial [Candidatus Tectomicrobia bacterium]
LYRPAAGGAIVFACSHLHEVTEVTQGRRFVLLSFLFGEGDIRPVRARSQDSAPPHPPSITVTADLTAGGHASRGA